MFCNLKLLTICNFYSTVLIRDKKVISSRLIFFSASFYSVLVLVLLISSGDSVVSCCSFSADEIRELWMEYEDNATLEAKVVKDFDKV
jgi:hypothetical protein